MNETFVVASSIDCSLLRYQLAHIAAWNQTMIGCKILNVLQDIFCFNVTYVIDNETFDLSEPIREHAGYSVDIYARPMSRRSHVLKLTHLLHHMFDWDFGFTIYRPGEHVQLKQFYTKPFSTIVWNCLISMAVFCAGLFYLLKRLETRIVGGSHWESSVGYEVLTIIGAYCQHIPPIDAVLYSRRGAYFAFLMFAYLIYTYYTSNLLSHLVNDKDRAIDARSIFQSDMEFVVVEDIKWIVNNYVKNIKKKENLSERDIEIYGKLKNMRIVTAFEGLQVVKSGNAALLSEYQLLEPWKRSVFENHEICGLINIDLVTKMRRYFFVSYNFPYKEEFKIALQRMEESGILQRMRRKYNSMTECVPLSHVQTHFSQIMPPLFILLFSYLLSVGILLGEMVHSRTNRLWPYLD